MIFAISTQILSKSALKSRAPKLCWLVHCTVSWDY